MKQMTTCLLSAVVGSVLTVGLLQTPSSIAIQAEDQPPLRAPRAQQPAKIPQEELTPDEEINVNIYERVNKCVVNITTKTPNVDPFFMTQSESEGAGSGSVLNKEGHILTNFHVIQDASRAIVTLYDGKSYPATLVGADPVNDVAVIKIDAPAETLIPVSFGDSGRLKVGMRDLPLGIHLD